MKQTTHTPTATIIQFPRELPPRPSFSDWMNEQMAGSPWVVVYRRTPMWRGIPWRPGTRLLLHREYDVLCQCYEARYGARF